MTPDKTPEPSSTPKSLPNENKIPGTGGTPGAANVHKQADSGRGDKK